MGYRRRTVLQGLGVGGTALTAGCLDGIFAGFMGGDYTSWVPSPAELATVERFNVVRIDPQSVCDADVVAQSAERTLADAVGRALELLGVPFAELSGLSFIGHFAIVFEGSFRTGRLADRLAGADFRSVGSHEGYALYADEATLVAVSADAVVFGPWAGEGTAGVIEGVIDAKVGEGQRYVGTDAAVAELTEVLGNGDLIVGRTGADVGPIDPVEATGIAWRFDGQTAKAAVAFVFPDGSTVDTDALGHVTERDTWADYDDLDIGQRGRVGVVTATAPKITADTLAPFDAIEQAVETRPTATFEATYGSEQRTATIIHAGGDAIPRSRLMVRGTGFRSGPMVEQDEPGPWAGATSAAETAVEPGDSMTVGIEPDATIKLCYRPIGREAVETLRTFGPG